MRQVLVFRIHTHSTLVLTSLLRSQLSLEGIVVSFFLDHLQWFDAVNALLSILVGIDVHLLQSNGIVKTLFVDDIAKSVLLRRLDTTSRIGPLRRHNVDSIPTLSNSLLPKSNLLSEFAVVLRNLLETLSLLVVELRS